MLAVDRSWSGPGKYALVVSATGLSGSNQSLFTGLGFYPYTVVPAWDYATYDYWNYGRQSCHPPSELAFLPGNGACPDYPKTYYDCYMWNGSLTVPGRTGVWIQVHFDPSFIADPAQRYTLLRIVFDHTNSVTGVVPGACDRVDEPMCFRLATPSLTDGNYVPQALAEERFYATWQDPANSLNCPASTPVRATTWGGLRVQYR